MVCWKYIKINSRNTELSVGLLLGSYILDLDYPNCIVI